MKPPACSWRTVMVLMLLLCRRDSTRSMFSSPACRKHFHASALHSPITTRASCDGPLVVLLCRSDSTGWAFPSPACRLHSSPMSRLGSPLACMHCDGLCASVRQQGPHTTLLAPCLQAILKSWPSAAWAGCACLLQCLIACTQSQGSYLDLQVLAFHTAPT